MTKNLWCLVFVLSCSNSSREIESTFTVDYGSEISEVGNFVDSGSKETDRFSYCPDFKCSNQQCCLDLETTSQQALCSAYLLGLTKRLDCKAAPIDGGFKVLSLDCEGGGYTGEYMILKENLTLSSKGNAIYDLIEPCTGGPIF